MPIPTRPTAPQQPLRSNPETFSLRAELGIQYQWGALPDWIEAVAQYAQEQASAAASAAALAGAAEGLNLEGKGGQFLRARPDETSTEFVNAEDARAGLGATLTGAAIFTATNAAAARAAIGATVVGSAVLTAADAASARSALSAQANLGFTPVQQGGGAFQATNKIYIGWDGGDLRAQVDAVDQGPLTKHSQTLGISQTWQNVTASRSAGTTYQNTTGKPISVSISSTGSGSFGILEVSADTSTWVEAGRLHPTTGTSANAIIPHGSYYRISNWNGNNWAELR